MFMIRTTWVTTTTTSTHQTTSKTWSCTLSNTIHSPVSQVSKSKLKSGPPQSLSSLASLSSELLSYGCLSLVQLGCLRLQLLQQLHGTAHVAPEIVQQASLQIQIQTQIHVNMNIYLNICIHM